eukprot:15432604-Alexandrium_andersonii.AAC.2
MPLRVLSASAQGHAGNTFGDYIYVCARNDPNNRGWAPTALVHQAGRCGAGAVTFGLKAAKWNDLAVRIVGTLRERCVVAHPAGGCLAAVKPEHLIVVDSERDLERVSQRQFTRKVHPDKGGDVQLLHLGVLLRRLAPPGGARR